MLLLTLLVRLLHLRPLHVTSICGAAAAVVVAAVEARLTTIPVTGRQCIKHDETTAKETAAMIALVYGLLGPSGIGIVVLVVFLLTLQTP